MKSIIAYLDDLLLFAGCLAIVYGVAQIYVPAAWIVCGAMLISLGVMYGKAKDHVIE